MTGNCYSGQSNSYKVCNFSKIEITESSKTMIVDAKFYANQMYEYERSSNVNGCTTSDGACLRTTA